MKALVILFLLWISFLRADWDQLFSDEEDPALFHHVNVITGNLNLCLQDAIIEGAKPLPLFRTYSSSGALEPPELNKNLRITRGEWLVQGGWNFLPHTNLWIDIATRCRHFEIYLPEPSGNLIPYSFITKEGEHDFVFKPTKNTGQCSGSLSARTNVNNYVLKLYTKKGEAVLSLPDGGSRIYKGESFRHWDTHHCRVKRFNRENTLFYRLIKEVQPSGHFIEYTYDKKGRLDRAAMKNPSGTKTFAWMDFSVTKRDSPFAFRVNTSDGKFLHYKTLEFREVDYICDVNSSFKPQECSGYTKGRKGIGARMEQMRLAGKLQFQASYHVPPNKEKAEKWAEHPEKKYFHIDKVSSLSAPLGQNGEILPFAHFSYLPNQTEVRDSSNTLTRYTHDGERLLTIEYCNEHGAVISVLRFLWENQRLKAKVMLDAQGRAYFSKVFEYDAPGNVIRETLWGSLTGETPGPFGLAGDGSLAGAEHYSKRYEYLPQFNVPTLEEEENGLTYRYQYKAGTNLITAKWTCRGAEILTREFLFYTEDNLLFAEITDDGRSPDPNDLGGVTERQIKRYDLDPSSGLVRAALELYLDSSSQSEVLLRKTLFTYSLENRVTAESIYDANDNHRYTLYTDYDAAGHIVRQTTPLGQENFYSYDSLGNLLTSKEVSSPQKIFHYDPTGRPAFVEEIDSLGTIKKNCTQYDSKGNLLFQRDSRGNVTEQEYDSFGRCTKTRFPKAVDEEAVPYLPTASFTYDIQGNISTSSIEGGGTTQTTYNALRKPVVIIQADGTSLHHYYSVNGELKQTTHSDGTYVVYQYDIFQQMISKKIYAATSQILNEETWVYNAPHLLSHTDPNGLTTHYTYDGAGRKISEKAETRNTSYSYDSLGFLEKQTEGDVSHIQIHDVGGRVTEEYTQLEDGRIENHMWFSYDNEDNKISARRITSQGKATDLFSYDREFRLARHTDPEGNASEILYTDIDDQAGRVEQKTITDPLGNQIVEIQDPLGRLAKRLQKDPSGHTTSQEEIFYDRSGNQAARISSVYHSGEHIKEICVRWEYDAMGRVVVEREGDKKTTYFAYDERGRLKTRILPDGTSIDYLYDGLGRSLETKSSDGSIHYQYTYENGSQPIEVADLVQHTLLKRKYNSFGDLILETNPYGFTSAWEYDEHGRCTALLLPDRSSITYTYRAGHLVEVSRLSSQEDLLYTHTYCDFDPNGHVAEENLIHQIGTLSTTYDLLERPHAQSSDLIEQSTSYGPSGLVAATKNSLLGDKIYRYDPLNQLIQEESTTYAFDSLGNPIDCQVNDCNQIIQSPDSLIEYDPNGNPIRRSSPEGITTYNYDALSRLTSITHPDKKQTRFFYDPLSRLAAQQSENTRLFYLHDKAQEIGTMNAKGELLELKVVGLGIKGEIGGAIAIELAGSIYAPLHDFQGNIIALVSAAQEIVETYTMNAFGKEEISEPLLNPWRFSSKRSTCGLILFGIRFYDPSLGRWLTPDPSGFTDGPNLYAYTFNSPLNRLDLFGLESDPRLPQEMRDGFRMDVPLSALLPMSVVPVGGMVPCKGRIAEVSVNWVVSSNHWHKLQYTPQEKETGIVNIVDHFQELVPTEGSTIGLITFENGICTSQKDLRKDIRSVVSMIPEGTLTIGMHNPSKGLLRDCKRTFKERHGKDTAAVVRSRQFMVALSETLYRINPDLLWLHICHSEGGAICNNAIKGMTPEQKDRLKQQTYLLGIGPAKPLPLGHGKGVTNIYSKQDLVTGVFALNYKNNPRYDIRFVRCRSSLPERTGFIADHAYLGGTYQWEQREYTRDLREQWGFYNGNTR